MVSSLLAFADDLCIVGTNFEDIELVVAALAEDLRRLNLHFSAPKCLYLRRAPGGRLLHPEVINIGGLEMTWVDRVIYLGATIIGHQEVADVRGQRAQSSVASLMRALEDMPVLRRPFEGCVLPALAYGQKPQR